MCMFSGSVSSVSQTNIFVSPLTAQGKQLTVYSNKVELGPKRDNKQVAMVLPFPTKDGSCKIINFSQYKTFFKDLDKLFPEKFQSRSFGFGGSAQNLAPARNMLAVERSGSYQYTVVPSWNDLDRVQSDVFNINLEVVKSMTKQYYCLGFGFLICIIDQSAEYYPIAYVHDMLPEYHLFVPTRHQHGNSKETVSDWSHSIYSMGTVSIHCGEEATVTNQNNESSTFPISLDKIFQVNLLKDIAEYLPSMMSPKYLHKMKIEGRRKNQDWIFTTYQSLMKQPNCTFFVTSNQHHFIQPWFMDFNNPNYSKGNGLCSHCVAEYRKQAPNCDVCFADHSQFFCDKGVQLVKQWDQLLATLDTNKKTWVSILQWIGCEPQQQLLTTSLLLHYWLRLEKKKQQIQVQIANQDQAIQVIKYLLLFDGNKSDYSIPELKYGNIQLSLQHFSAITPTPLLLLSEEPSSSFFF